jgi:hypothetical protein
MKNIQPSTRAYVHRRCPSIVAERIIERACAEWVKHPDGYVFAAVHNWEVEQHRRAIAAEKRRQERALEKAAVEEQMQWEHESKRRALRALARLNTVNSVTFALWIDSGLSGTEFAKQYNITRDCLYQRKLRARAEVLRLVDASAAAWMYQYGVQRVSLQRGETKRRKTARAA